MRVIEIVKMMFKKRANEGVESANSWIIVQLFKECEGKCVNNYRCVSLLLMWSRILARVTNTSCV